jgi:hypothetical protein
LQAGGRRFEPGTLHDPKPLLKRGFSRFRGGSASGRIVCLERFWNGERRWEVETEAVTVRLVAQLVGGVSIAETDEVT